MRAGPDVARFLSARFGIAVVRGERALPAYVFGAESTGARVMAVQPDAGPVERALDEIARSIESPPFDLGDQLVAALGCAALWRVVYAGAMRDEDPKLASIAVDQIRHAHEAYRGLAAISDARKTLDLGDGVRPGVPDETPCDWCGIASGDHRWHDGDDEHHFVSAAYGFNTPKVPPP